MMPHTMPMSATGVKPWFDEAVGAAYTVDDVGTGVDDAL
jgi:hypothetical protein